MAIMHYAVLCNYFWLLIEAVYLQSILSYAMTDQEHFSHYMAIGWGMFKNIITYVLFLHVKVLKTLKRMIALVRLFYIGSRALKLLQYVL